MNNDPDQIRQDIERTRANLSYDVNALADEAHPKNIAQRQADKAVDGVRSGVRNLKERIMGTDDTQYTYNQYNQAQYGNEPSVADKAREAKGAAGEKLDEARFAVQDAAGQARDAAQQAPAQVRQQVRGNPLAAGLVAFGIGSIIGSLFPATRYESQAADQLKEKAQPMVDEVKGMAQDAVEQVKPLAQDAADEVKQVAADAKDNVQEQAARAKDSTVQQAQEAKQNVQQAHDGQQDQWLQTHQPNQY